MLMTNDIEPKRNQCKYDDMMFRCMCDINGLDPKDCLFYVKHSDLDKCRFYREKYGSDKVHCDNTKAHTNDYQTTEVNNGNAT